MHMDLSTVNNRTWQRWGTVQVNTVQARGMTTFAYKYDTNPKRRIAGRDAHKDTVQLCIPQARATLAVS